MKCKYFLAFSLVFWAIVVFCAIFAVNSHAASTATVTRPVYKNNLVIHQIDITADATDGSIDDVPIKDVCGLVAMVSVEPGAPAPTDQYDIALVENRTDTEIMGWELLNLTVTDARQFSPKIGNAYAVRPVCGELTLTVKNNAVAGAKVKVTIYEIR